MYILEVEMRRMRQILGCGVEEIVKVDVEGLYSNDVGSDGFLMSINSGF